MSRLLVIDDDPALQRALRIALTALGHEVLTASSGERGLSETALGSPEVIVVDLGLPDIDGVEVCRRLREWSTSSIIVLSADGREDRKIAALDAGADDYMTKPFGMGELQARVRAALRRRPADPDADEPTTLTAGPLELDLVHHEALLNGEKVDLTAREFSLLAYLARHPGRICTHRMILEHVWGPGYATETQYLRTYAYRLRRKLGDVEGKLLKTDPGIGYALVAR